MSKAQRLIEMMITINAKRSFTVGELADEFGVSKRTVLRDLRELEEAGFPLYSEVGAAGGYRLLKERILPPITFSVNEAKAVFFACQALQFYRDLPFDQENLSVVKKFLNCLSPDMQNTIIQMQKRLAFWIPDRHQKSPLLSRILELVLGRYAVVIRYTSMDKESVRTIVPIGLYAMNGLWYCPAYCIVSGQIREFRVDRIQEIIEEKPVQAGKYPIPDSILDYLAHLEEGKELHVKIYLSDMGVKRCETEFLLARGLRTLSEGGGIIELDIREATMDWLADYLLSLGNHAVVLEPDKLKRRIKEKVELLYQQYCK